MEKLEPLFIAGRNVKWYSHCGKQYGGSSKTQNYHMIQQSCLGIYSKEVKAGSQKILVHKCHSGITHNSQKLEKTQVSMTDEWINKMCYIHTMECYAALKRKEILTCYSMDEP